MPLQPPLPPRHPPWEPSSRSGFCSALKKLEIQAVSGVSISHHFSVVYCANTLQMLREIQPGEKTQGSCDSNVQKSGFKHCSLPPSFLQWHPLSWPDGLLEQFSAHFLTTSQTEESSPGPHLEHSSSTLLCLFGIFFFLSQEPFFSFLQDILTKTVGTVKSGRVDTFAVSRF